MHASTMIGMALTDGYMILVFSAGTALSLVKATETRGTTETSVSRQSGEGGKPKQKPNKTEIDMEAPRSLENMRQESNTLQMVHWPASQRTEPHASPNGQTIELSLYERFFLWLIPVLF